MNHRRAKQTGLTLIELMIGIVVGLIIIAGTISVYVTTVQGSNYTLRSNRLNQDMRAVMDIMASDIRRAGYWSGALACAIDPDCDTENPFSDIDTDGSTITFSYDLDGSENPVANSFGFRLEGNVVQMLNEGVWRDLTDPESVTVTALTFSTEGSQCLNTDLPTDADNPWPAASGSDIPACDPTATGYTASPGDLLVETRQIAIEFRGRHANDATMQKALADSVKVRNNRIVTAPTP